MKLTKQQLKQIIKEAIASNLFEKTEKGVHTVTHTPTGLRSVSTYGKGEGREEETHEEEFYPSDVPAPWGTPEEEVGKMEKEIGANKEKMKQYRRILNPNLTPSGEYVEKPLWDPKWGRGGAGEDAKYPLRVHSDIETGFDTQKKGGGSYLRSKGGTSGTYEFDPARIPDTPYGNHVRKNLTDRLEAAGIKPDPKTGIYYSPRETTRQTMRKGGSDKQVKQDRARRAQKEAEPRGSYGLPLRVPYVTQKTMREEKHMKITKQQLKQIIKEELTKLFEGTGTGADTYEGDISSTDPGLGYSTNTKPFYTDFGYLTLPREQWPEGTELPSDVVQAQRQGREIIPASLTTVDRKALENPHLQLDPNTGRIVKKIADPQLKRSDYKEDVEFLKKMRAKEEEPGAIQKMIQKTTKYILDTVMPEEEQDPTSFDQFYKDLDDFGLGYLLPPEDRDKIIGPQHREALAMLKHAKKEATKGAKGQIISKPQSPSIRQNKLRRHEIGIN